MAHTTSTNMRRIRKAIKKASKRKLKSNDSSKAKIIMPLNSGVGILTEKDQNVPKSDSLSQFPRKRSSSQHLTKARSLCNGQLQGGSLLFHQINNDIIDVGSASKIDNRKSVEITCDSGLLDKTSLVTEATAGSGSLTISSSWGSESFAAYNENVCVHALEMPSNAPPQLISPTTTVFIRANDLHTTVCDQQQNDQHRHRQVATFNTSHPYLYGPTPNPNLSDCMQDRWIAMNDIHNSPSSSNNNNSISSPVLRQAVSEIYLRGLELISNESLWIPDRKTERYLKALKVRLRLTSTTSTRPDDMSIPTSPLPPLNLLGVGEAPDDVVRTWSASIGSHICTRAEGVIDTGAKWLFELLLDSSRVKEFNKLSLGREDVWVMEKRRNDGGGTSEVTKVIRGNNKAPMVSKPIVFHQLMHGRELEGGAGYAIVTRTARLVEDGSNSLPQHSLMSELYTGIMLILRIEGRNNRCVMVNSSQFTSPVPAMVTKRVGLASAVTMFQDIRKLGEGIR